MILTLCIGFGLTLSAKEYFEDSYYYCGHDTFVKYNGVDSKEKQLKAKKEFGCDVQYVMGGGDAVYYNWNGQVMVIGEVK
jgi:hypothetical protein